MHQGPDPPDAKRVFEILANEHADMLDAYLRTLVAFRPGLGLQPDDLFQETMLVAWRRLGAFDRSRPFAAWLRGIAQMLVIEHARKSAARPRPTDPAVLAAIDSRFAELDGNCPADFPSRAEQVWRCVRALPDAMRQAVELIYTRGLSMVAAAAASGEHEETIKKRVQRARQLIADCLRLGTSGGLVQRGTGGPA